MESYRHAKLSVWFLVQVCRFPQVIFLQASTLTPSTNAFKGRSKVVKSLNFSAFSGKVLSLRAIWKREARTEKNWNDLTWWGAGEGVEGEGVVDPKAKLFRLERTAKNSLWQELPIFPRRPCLYPKPVNFLSTEKISKNFGYGRNRRYEILNHP